MVEALTQKKRTPATVLATCVWCQELKRRNAYCRPYALERIYEPEAFGWDEHGDQYHRNKWSKYDVGLGSPHPRMVDRVEEAAPGTAWLLRHPLWRVLYIPAWSVGQYEKWIVGLGDVETIVRKRAPRAAGNRPWRIDLPTIKMIERRAGLDAIAALTILLYETVIRGDQKRAMDLGNALFRTLLIAADFPVFSAVKEELFWLFKTRVFPLVNLYGATFDFGGYRFDRDVTRLSIWFMQLEDMGLVAGVDRKAVTLAKLKVLDGRFGFDLMFKMRPPIRLPDGSLRTYDDNEGEPRVTRNADLPDHGSDGKRGCCK